MKDSEEIFFGLNRASDEKSLATFLRLFGEKRLTEVLVPRMSTEEINQTVDFLTGIMRQHLREKEYHQLFLGEEDPHNPEK